MLKKITVEKVILFLAAGFAAYNFGLAGGFIEGQVFSVGGLIAGVVVNVSLAVAASRYGSITGAKRTKQAQAAFWAMLIISPSLVAPVIYYSLPVTFLAFAHADVWWLNILSSLPRIVWSLAWPAGADLAIVLAGAVSGKGLIALSEPSATQSVAGATESAKSASGVRRSAKASAKSATESVGVQRSYPRTCEHCATVIASPNAVGAHMKKHHPELCKPKSLAVNLFENKSSESVR